VVGPDNNLEKGPHETMKEIMIIYGTPLKEYFNFWPRWLWIANGLLVAVSLLIIFCL
jgi:hypothetical protein